MDSSRSSAQWIEERRDQGAAGSAFAFTVVDCDDTVLARVSLGAVNRRHSTGWVSY